VGSPLSPMVADLVLQQLETHIVYDLPVKPIFYFKYVDDIALAALNSSFNNFMDRFNSFCGDQYNPTKLITTQYARQFTRQLTRGKFTRDLHSCEAWLFL